MSAEAGERAQAGTATLDAEAAAEFASAFSAGVAGLGGVDSLRDALDAPAGLLAEHREMMDELGLGGLLIGEDFGGLGAGLDAAVAIGRQAGRAPGPDLVGPYVMAPVLLAALADTPTAAGVLEDLAAGSTRVTVAVDGLVFDGQSAAAVIVYSGDELRLLTQGELELEELPAFDPTRTLHRVGADGRGTRVAAGDAARRAWDVALAAGRIYLAAELEGTARAMLETTVEYLGQRVEFGRPLGSFQALKHQLADMWSEISLIGPLVDKAVAEFASRAGAFREAELYAAAALSLAADTATAVCERGLQLHGGIGYTWESTVHLWLKRAAANRVRLGTPHALRAAVAKLADI